MLTVIETLSRLATALIENNIPFRFTNVGIDVVQNYQNRRFRADSAGLYEIKPNGECSELLVEHIIEQLVYNLS